MRTLAILLAAAISGCCTTTQQTGETTPGPEAREQAVREVTALAEEHCAHGLHGTLDHVATDDPLLIVGTAGETRESRALLEETNAQYSQGDIEVVHECESALRWVHASQAADVVWVEETIRTRASMPGFNVAFPSQRTMIFERTPEGWRMRFYALNVLLDDDRLDAVYGQSMDEQPAPAAAGAADAPVAAPEAAAD